MCCGRFVLADFSISSSFTFIEYTVGFAWSLGVHTAISGRHSFWVYQCREGCVIGCFLRSFAMYMITVITFHLILQCKCDAAQPSLFLVEME